MKLKYLLVLLFVVMAGNMARAQCNPVLAADSSQFGVDGYINCGTVKGNILYLGGSFYHIGQYSGCFVGIDTASGKTLNRATWPHVNGQVFKVISDGAGGWIIGGLFSKVGDSVRTNLAQIDAAGHVTMFNPHPDSVVKALALADGYLYAGGNFAHIAGANRLRLAKLSFPAGIPASWTCSANSMVTAFELNNGWLWAGGYFTTIGGQSRTLMAAVDTGTGSISSWNGHVNGTGSLYSPPYVQTITFHGTTVYVGGNFTTAGGQTRNNIAALDTATTLATPWNPVAGGAVCKIIHNGSSIYVAGQFSSIASVSRNGFCELDTTYGLVTAFNPAANLQYCFFNDMLHSGNKIFLAGGFEVTPVLLSQYNALAMIDIAGDTAYGLRWVCDNDVNTLAMSGPNLYAGGYFQKADIKARMYTAAIDMSADTLTNWSMPVGNEVLAIATGPTDVYVGGTFVDWFAYSTSSDAFYITAGDLVTGARDTAFHSYVEYSSEVHGIWYDNGNLYLTGFFAGIESYSRNQLAKISATTGHLDINWNPSDYFASSITTLAFDDNNVYVGGIFNTLGFQPRRNLGAVDKVLGHATAWNPSPNSSINSMFLDNGKINAVGYFDTIGTVYAPKMARVSATTGVADTWSPHPDEEPLIIRKYYNTAITAGYFSHIGATAIGGMGMVKTNSNIPFTWNPLPSSDSVKDIVVYQDRMYVLGNFTHIAGQSMLKDIAVFRLPPVPDTLNVTMQTPVCTGSAGHFTAATGIAGSNFYWQVNGVNAGTNADTFSYIPASGDIVSCSSVPPVGGCYTTDTATAGNIAVTVTAPVMPAVTVSGPASVCFGSTATYTAAATIAPAAYIWRVNGVNVGTGSSYTYIPANGDQLTCKITTPAGGCFLADSALSPALTITSGAPVTPTIVLSAVPLAAAGTLVTVNATVTNAGSSYQIKWYDNGGLYGTTTTPTFNYIKNAGTDIITAVIHPSATSGCYDTAASNAAYTYEAVGVNDVAGPDAIQLYPDPFTDVIIVKGLQANDRVCIYDAYGRKVQELMHTGIAASEEHVATASLMPGVYYVQITDVNGTTRSRKTIVKK